MVDRLHPKNLSTRILLAVLALFVAGIWGLAVRVAAVLQADLETLVSDQLSATVGYVAADIDNKLRLRFDVLDDIAASITPDMLADPARIQRLLEQRNVSRALFPVGVLVANKQGVPVADWPRLPGRVGDSGSLGDRAWFHEVMSGRKQGISAPLVGRFAKQPLVSTAVPILDASGKPAAALVGSVHPSDRIMFGELEQTKIGKTGTFIVASPKDNLIVSATDKSRILQPLPAKGVNPLLDRRLHQGFEGPGITVTSLGIEVLTASRNLKTTGWIVMAGIPTEEAFAPIATLKRQIYLAALLLSLVVLVILRFILARQLAPIEQAGAAMQRMTEGKEPFASLPVVRNDEIGRLVGNFNRLVAERSRLDETLRHSEEHLRILFDSLPIAVGHADKEERITFVNRLYRTFYGGDGDPVRRTLRETIDERSYAAAEPYIRRTLAGEEIHLERTFTRDDGATGVRSIRYVPDRDSSGEVVGFFALIEDVTERKQAEEARAQLAAIVESSDDAIISRSLDGTILSWNAAAERLLGYSASEAIGRPITLVFPAGHEADPEKHSSLLLGGAQIPPTEVVRLTKDGRLIEVLRNLSPIRNEAGQISGVAIVMRDISERKRAETELREAEERYRSLLTASPDGIWLHCNGRVEYVNDALVKMLGYGSPGEIVGRDIYEVFAPEAREALRARVEQVMSQRALTSLTEALVLKRDGSRISVETTAAYYRQGEAVWIISIMRDITARKRAEAQMRLAASVFDSAAEGIIISDANNNILSVNRAFTEITGYTAEEVAGKNPRMLSSGRQTDAFYEAMWASINETGRWQGEIWDRRKDGGYYYELLSISAVRNDQGEVTQYCAIIADITQRKVAEAELSRLNAELEERVAQRTTALAEVNKELEAFCYSISHDLRAPLRAINGFSKIVLAATAGKLDAETVDHLGRIAAAAERMGRLIDDLLSLSQVSRQVLHRQAVNLSELAGEAARNLAEAQPERQVDVLIAPGMMVDGDQGLIQIVLENLIGNAWKFTARADGARIEVGQYQRDGETVCFVRDNGAGFDMRYAGKLFGAFQRLHTLREFEGTGIGLSIVQRILGRHGGRIWAEAKPGEGATFHFTLAPGTSTV